MWFVENLPFSNQLGQLWVHWGELLFLQSMWFMKHMGQMQFFIKPFILNNKNYSSGMVIREASMLADVLRKSFSEKNVSKAIRFA